MTQALEVRALDIIDEWFRTGQINPSDDSIKTRIQMAALTGEISEGMRLAMVSVTPKLVKFSLQLKLADQYSIIKKADVSPNDLDIVEENLGRLYDSILGSDDEAMLMIYKMIFDFVENLRKDSQRSQQGEQLDYSHENEGFDGGVNVEKKQAPSEMTQGSGGGQSHVN